MFPDTVLLLPIVQPDTRNDVNVPVSFSTRKLSSMAPRTVEFTSAQAPNALSKITLPSRPAVLVPLAPFTTRLLSVTLVTLEPRMPKFWQSLICIHEKALLPLLFMYTPIPVVASPSTPVLFAIVPPEPALPVPVTVKPPLVPVLSRIIPVAEPPLEVTL